MAERAVVGAALGDNDAADRTGAAGAGFPGAAEDLRWF